jgi:hypothetical protein
MSMVVEAAHPHKELSRLAEAAHTPNVKFVARPLHFAKQLLKYVLPPLQIGAYV